MEYIFSSLRLCNYIQWEKIPTYILRSDIWGTAPSIAYFIFKNRINQHQKFGKTQFLPEVMLSPKKLFYEKCSICDEDFPVSEQSILTCGHVFHTPCYKSYFESHIYSYKCPKCKARQTLTGIPMIKIKQDYYYLIYFIKSCSILHTILSIYEAYYDYKEIIFTITRVPFVWWWLNKMIKAIKREMQINNLDD